MNKIIICVGESNNVIFEPNIVLNMSNAEWLSESYFETWNIFSNVSNSWTSCGFLFFSVWMSYANRASWLANADGVSRASRSRYYVKISQLRLFFFFSPEVEKKKKPRWGLCLEPALFVFAFRSVFTPSKQLFFFVLSVSVDHSRIHLQQGRNDYINASLISVEAVHRNYILTQVGRARRRDLVLAPRT